jgi:hypothetical protein
MVLDASTPAKIAAKDILIRAQRDDKDRAIGVLEKGAEFYLMQVVSGWANVLPKDLNLSPPGGGGFWIKAEDAP